MAKVKSFYDPDTGTITHVLWDQASGRAAVIDPVLDFDPATQKTATRCADQVISFLNKNDLVLRYILETHVHADHLTAARYLRDKLGGKMAICECVGEVQAAFAEVFNTDVDEVRKQADFDVLLKDGDQLNLGDTMIRVMATPGHTPACITYVIDGAAFVGDTIFMPDSGTARCDFPGGDAACLYQSIQRLLALPDDTVLYLCHDYGAEGKREVACQTTVGEQKANNIHVGGDISLKDYVEMRTSRDATLSEPRLLKPSVQVNMRAGNFPKGGLKD